MVATVLKLRYRILGNTLKRSVSQLIGFIFGLLGGLYMLAMLTAGLVVLAIFQDVEVARLVVVLGGSALLLGWVLGPVLISGIESTVDAGRLAPFPLTTAQTMRALAATGFTGIPGIITSLAALATLVLWIRVPLAAIVAVPFVAVAVASCVVASRLVGTASAGLGRSRQVIATLMLVLIMLSGPIVAVTMLLLSVGDGLVEQFARIAEALSWTPLGAAWAVPGEIALGAWIPALAKALIALATLGILWWLWARALRSLTVSPPRKAASGAKRKLGLFGRMPTGGVGASWARSLTAWLHDPRYSRSLIVMPILPIVFAFTGTFGRSDDELGIVAGTHGFLFRASALLVAFILSFALYADISFDGTAFTSVLSSGIRGWQDRLGRILGAAVIGVPLIVLLAVVCALIAGTPGDLPAVLGGSLGVLLAGYGVTAVSSALLVVPAPAPGDNPFKSVPGQTFVMGLMVFVVWAVCGVLGGPALVLAILSLVFGSALLGWIALAVGVVVGLGVLAAGVAVGGRILDRTGPDLLLRIKAFPTS